MVRFISGTGELFDSQFHGSNGIPSIMARRAWITLWWQLFVAESLHVVANQEAKEAEPAITFTG